MRRRYPLVALMWLALAAVPPLRSALGDDIDEAAAAKTVAGLLEKASGADVSAIWALSRQMESGGKPAIPALRAAAATKDAAGRLAIGRALVLLDDLQKGIEILQTLADDAKAPVALRIAAIGVIGQDGETEQAEWLAKAVDAVYDPTIKIAMAKALWNLPSTAALRTKGKSVMLEFLKSEDKDRRAEGALALGEIGAASEAKQVLLELRDEPTERGRSAQFLLNWLNSQAISEARLRVPPPSAPPAAASSWPLLDEMRTLLRATYVDEKAVDAAKLEDGAAQGMTRSLDPYTEYMSPEENAQLLEQLDNTYGGVGAYVHNDPDNATKFTISRPIFGGPIYRAGLHSDDVVEKVDGKPTLGLSVEECVRMLKGPAGTKVVVTIRRPGWTETQDFTLVRALISIPTTAYDVLPGKIGCLQIHTFGETTAREVHQILDDFEAQGVRGIVLDLRGNTGGYLKAAVEIASEFLPAGAVVVSERGRQTVHAPRVHNSTGAGERRARVPVVALINGGTASAAEILSGALQTHGRARLVGGMSFGKGLVQLQYELRTRPGEAFTDVARSVVSRWDDLDGNGRVDEGEPVVTRTAKNARFDPAEKFTDANGDGVWNAGEPFVDANQNGDYDPAEAFEDANKNGKWDPGASFKVTVAKYYLPDDRNLDGKYEVKDGRIVRSGGIVPDVEVRSEELDLWERQGQQALDKAGAVRKYAEDAMAKDPALFESLARSDRRDPSAYPGFDAFYKGLDTKLSPQPVRLLVRLYVRRSVGDRLGRELVGDVVDDHQLRHALIELLKEMKVDPATLPEIAFLANEPPPKKEAATKDAPEPRDAPK